MKVIDTKVDVKHCGNAPVDFKYDLEQEVLLDDNSRVYVQIQMIPSGELYYVVNTTSLFGEEELADPIEIYEELKQTKKSKFYKNFKELDAVLDNTIKEVMDKLDDTRNFDGIRCGAQFNSKGINKYVEEAFYLDKENKCIYLQIRKTKGDISYSITESSIFMRMDMGDLYEVYFGDKPDVPFIIEVDNINQLGQYEYLKDEFVRIEQILNNQP